MNVLFLSPGFPAEMPYFVRGLAQVGAKVLGVGDQPEALMPDVARDALSAYLRVPNLWDEDAVIRAVREWDLPVKLDRVECLWEPGMILAAKLREAFGLPGMTVQETIPFRDKDRMKQVLVDAEVRTPKHFRAATEIEVRDAAQELGYPLVIKPIAGAGSADTYRLNNPKELEEALQKLGHVDEVSVEEFIEGKEFTFDTICADGMILYYNVAWYRPNVLTARSEEWISPQTITLNDLTDPGIQAGIRLGFSVIKALNFRTGFTHMEWFLTSQGEAVFGEIGARPPGGRSVELMNYGCDIDVFRGWAEATCYGRLSQKVERKFNAAIVFKRAKGSGFIKRIEGLDEIKNDLGGHITCINLLPVGAPRRNWKQTLISDGYIILRHPELAQTIQMADRIAKDLTIYATHQ